MTAIGLYDWAIRLPIALFSLKRLAEVINAHYTPGDEIVINGYYEKGSSLNYYTGRQVYFLNGDLGMLWYGLQDKTAPKLWLSQKQLIHQWNSGKRIFLFSPRDTLKAFFARRPDFKYRVLSEKGGKDLLVNWKRG